MFRHLTFPLTAALQQYELISANELQPRSPAPLALVCVCVCVMMRFPIHLWRRLWGLGSRVRERGSDGGGRVREGKEEGVREVEGEEG